MTFAVTRQCYWGVDPDECWVVEIAGGGLDYANPDMLCARFPGEGQVYSDPREAVTAALEIAKLWKKEEPEKNIRVASGFTGGFTMPFEPSNGFELVKWANKLYGKMPRCDQCGELLPDKNWYTDEFREYKFCREFCAEKYQEELERLNAQEEEAECPAE